MFLKTAHRCQGVWVSGLQRILVMSGGVCTTSAGIAPRDLKANTSCAANKQECGAGHWDETFIVKQVRRVSKGRVISCVAHIYIVFSWDYTLSVWHMNWCGYRVARILSGQRGDLEGKQTKHLKLTVVQGSETRGLIKGLHLQSLLYTFITVMAWHLGKCAFLPPKRCPSLCYSCDTCLSVS